jgi:hypothetical protein
MSNTLREVRWPFFVLVVVLFVLSLFAPRQWRFDLGKRSRIDPSSESERATVRRGFDTLARGWPPGDLRRDKNGPAERPLVAAEHHDGIDSPVLGEAARPADVSAHVARNVAPPGESPAQPAVTARANPDVATPAEDLAADEFVTEPSRRDATTDTITDATASVASQSSEESPLGISPAGRQFDPAAARASNALDIPHPIPHVAADRPNGDSDVATAPWPMPIRTVGRLGELAKVEATRGWAGEMLCVLDDLRRGIEMSPDKFAETIGHLERLLASAEQLEASLANNSALSSEVTRVRLAIARRIDAWRAVYALNQVVRGDRLASRDGGESLNERDPKSILRILPSSQAILADEAVALLDDIESYEEAPSAHTARKIALAARKLTTHRDASAQKFGQHVDFNYRNANLRVAAHGQLLNRFLPQPTETAGDINDYVAGVPVRGTQRTRTRLFLRLLPDDRRIRFGLEAHGEVDSDTAAQSGPATVFTTGETRFLARKLVLFDENRWRLFPAVADAHNESSLSGMRTDFDPFPILDSIAHSIVRSKHEERRRGAEREVENRVSHQAQAQLDTQADPRFAELTNKATETVVDPLRRLELEPTPIALATTDERAILRYRLAGPEQLGGHTPRPRAPADSWLSVQLHETAINNALANLDLAGRTFELRGLYESVAARLNRPDLKAPADVPENVQVTFADENPLNVRLIENAAQVTLRIARIDADRQTWRDLTVIAVYEPEVNGLDAIFARHTPIRLAGKNLNTRSSIVLRGVFSKMFTRNQQVHLLPDRILSDKRLAGLAVNQLVVHDGWVGLAIGPRRAAGQVVDSSIGDSESASREDGARR